MLRYALYTRKSDERREVTEKSTSEQLAECRALAPGLGTIAREFVESKSAKVPDVRPLFREMIRQIKAGEADAILCWKVDRLARNMKEGGEIAQLLIDGKIKEIRTPHACYRPGDNILPLVLETATSTQYSLDLKINVVRGLSGHFERGGWNARAPQGYRNNRDLVNPKVGTVVADEPRFTLLRKGWDMMLTGAYGPGQVAKMLSEVYGYRTRTTVSRGGTPLSRSYAYKIFTNPFYAGYTWYMGQLRPGVHPAMVTEAEFGRVQEILGMSTVTHAHVREFAYTGLMRCGHCGAQITAELHQVKAAGGTTKPHRFYRCADSKGVCTKRGLSEAKVEAAIERALASVTIEPELCAIAQENLLRSLEGRSEEASVIYAQQNAALADVEGQQSRLLSMWLRGLLTDEGQYKAMEAKLAREKRNLLLKTGACRDELERMRANAEAGFRYAEYARQRFLVGDAKRKREIAKVLAAEYTFFGPERRIEIAVKPLLCEVVRYAQSVEQGLRAEEPPDDRPAGNNLMKNAPAEKKPAKSGSELRTFEPQKVGPGSFELGQKVGGVLCGRTAETVLGICCVQAPSLALLEALRGEFFPEILGFQSS